MAFDYGSIDLGIKNPFKLEGSITAVRGLLQSGVGGYLLISAASEVKTDPGIGWILMGFGVLVLAYGLRTLAGGIFATLRYFVGRNHPTSLAQNFSRSQSSTAKEEAGYVGYTHKQLEEMLVGRKNSTFVEPHGFMARLLHSLLPKLLFMPYPIRNLAQRLFAAWVGTLVALGAYALVAFVTLAGFAGDVGRLTFPVYSVLLMLYLLNTWRKAGRPISRNAELHVEQLGSGTLVKIVTLSLLMPVVVALGISWLLQQGHIKLSKVDALLVQLPSFHSYLYVLSILLLAVFCSALLLWMLGKRMAAANAVAEVSELRENWQESVHPNEIFINLDNLVMANRRYREVPNRVYRELDPQLHEQSDGKGGFRGEMIQEVQPRVKPLEHGSSFSLARMMSLISGNLLFVAALVTTSLLAFTVVDLYGLIHSEKIASLNALLRADHFALFSTGMSDIVHLLLIGAILRAFARLLTNTAHLFFAEIQFESLLVYFKCEGTFTESKISTGTGIHDSTRSENTLVRSSITPWVIVTRLLSSTFAAPGLKNLEHPRHIIEMHKDDQQLQAIKEDVISFLKDRESIAAITSARDLGNASQIHQLNQQTRAIPMAQRLEQDDEEAAGYLIKEREMATSV